MCNYSSMTTALNGDAYSLKTSSGQRVGRKSEPEAVCTLYWVYCLFHLSQNLLFLLTWGHIDV